MRDTNFAIRKGSVTRNSRLKNKKTSQRRKGKGEGTRWTEREETNMSEREVKI